MRKILLFAAAAAALLSGCNKQLVDETNNGVSNNQIGFETYVYNTTKGLAKGGFVMGDQFKVIGGKTGTNVPFDLTNVNFTGWVFEKPNFADTSALVSNYGNNVWRYENPVSWGVEDVTFFAFSPAPIAPVAGGNPGNGITYTAPTNLTTIPSIKFEVLGGYDVAKNITDAEAVDSRPLTKQQIDLLWVCTPNQSKANRTVNLMFKHALTRLAFAVRSNAPAGQSIRINSIALKNVTTNGTLTLAHDETKSGEETYVGGWAAGSTKKSFAVNLINSVASLIKDNDIHQITDNDEALMMIPQSLAGVELEVKYAHSVDGTTWENYETGVPVTVKLEDLASHWNPNKQIRYVLNITPGEVIGFTADVETWGAEGDVEFISLEAGKDAQNVKTLALVAGDKLSAKTNDGWVTYAEGANAAADLTNTEVTAVAGNYTIAVKNNITPVVREEQITISHADGKKTVIKLTQGAGDGIIKAPVGAGDVATFTLGAGDKITVPQTKAAASWILVNGNAISAEYTTEGAAKISVEANAGVKRAATFDVTIGGVTSTYTIEQDGTDAPTEVAVSVAADGTFTPAVNLNGYTISAIVDGAWLKVDGTEIANGEVSTAGALTADVNATNAARTAKFTATKGSEVKNYTVNQAAGVTPPTPTDVTVTAKAAGTLTTDALAGYTISELSDGSWLKVDNNAIANGVVSGLGVITADINTTTSSREATFTATSADGLTIKKFTVTQDAATTVVIAELAFDGTDSSTGDQDLSEGDKILVSSSSLASWFTFSSVNDGSAAEYNGSAEVIVTVMSEGPWHPKATDNTISQEDRSGSFTVVKADGNVVVYTVSQAKA